MQVDTTKKIASPHDRYFKAAMADIVVARDFFERNLPQKFLSCVDLGTLKLCPNTYIEQDLKLSAADVLYEVTSLGETTYVYLLLEHQSTVDPFMPLRMWQYRMGIWADHRKSHPHAQKIPPIIPMIFYTGKKKWNASLELKDLIEGSEVLVEELYRPPCLLDSGHMRDEVLISQMWSGVLAYLLKQAQYKDPFLKDQVWKMMGHLEDIGSGSFVATSVKYAIINGVEINMENFWARARKHLSCNMGGKIMNLAQQWFAQGEQEGIEKGIQKGIEKGIEKGIQKGRQEKITILLSLLSKKFKIRPEAYLTKIEQADSEQLFVWINRVWDAVSLEDVFATEYQEIH